MNRNNGVATFAIVTALFLLLSWLRLEPGAGPQGASADGIGSDIGDVTESTVLGEQSSGGGADTGATGSGPSAGSARQAGASQRATATTVAAGRGFECAPGRNGGATDTGVSATKIRLATTAVLDGPAKTLLEDSPLAMKAVVDKVNRAGGICGRLLDLTVVNDTFDAASGLRIIRNFVDEGYFALPVVPSAEGLGSAIESGVIAKAGIPVIGTDGMRREQYTEPNVWPVASATVTAMRVMAKYGATNRQARRFAIVWDEKYKFGKEGREAFVAQVQAMNGTMGPDISLNPDENSYAPRIQTFNSQCNDETPCDMVALLLLPETAKKWLQGGPNRASLYTAGAQTLFTDRFAQDCVLYLGSGCQGFAVWTGYNPPIGPLASLPGVSGYVKDVRAVKPNIDVNNQFVEGAYLGMNVFVEALRRVGPDLTRARLKAVMDSMTFTSDLASPLTWTPAQHAANVRSQSFSMTVSQGTFRGWSNEGTGFLLDPAHGG